MRKNIYLEDHISALLDTYAEKTGQSVSSIIKNLVAELLKKEGYIK